MASAAPHTRLCDNFERARKTADALKEAGVPEKDIILVSNSSGKILTDGAAPGDAVVITVATEAVHADIIDGILQAQPDDARRAGPNEGEGSRTAARAYNRHTQDFVAGGKVEERARQAASALDSAEAAELKRAEAKGKSHSHGEDPKLTRRF